MRHRSASPSRWPLWFAITALSLLALLVGPPAFAQGRTVVEGQAFDNQTQVAEATLKLNGVGLRAVAWIKGYAAGLYLGEKTSQSATALAAPGPKRIQMRMMQNVPAAEFVKAFGKGVARNSTPQQVQSLQERMQRFDKLLADIGQVNKGDVVDLDYLPHQGLVLRLNGKPRGEPIAGDDLYAALLRIFIGDKPVDERLKASLLGAAWS